MSVRRAEEVWADLEMMRDGTVRWLWQVRDHGGLFRAGVAMSRTDAQRDAAVAVQRYTDQVARGDRIPPAAESMGGQG